MLKFLVNEPALMIDKALVIADLHIGLEYELIAAGFNIPAQSEVMLKKIKRLLKKNGCKELIVIGDVKHAIAKLAWPEQEELADFLNELESITKLHIVKGNHDGNIEKYAKRVYPNVGFEYKGYWITHGHTNLPNKAKNRTVIMGHIHPVIEFKDSLGGRLSERVWIVSDKLVVLPAFNDLLGGIDVREAIKREGIDPRKADLYLLDGLHIGRISQLKARK